MTLKRTPVETYHISKTFNAPLKFVFSWCTDFRSDDSKMIGGTSRRVFFLRSKKLFLYKIKKKGLKSKYDPIRAVWLKPPNSWHLETCGDGSEIGDYRLKRLGSRRTRLDMTFKVTYERPGQIESKKKWEADSRLHWDAYGRFLEKDYQRSLRKR